MLTCSPPRRISSIRSRSRLAACAREPASVDAASLLRYPTDRDALRIVQYDSCRGLEGWTVINYALDEFWRYKFEECISKDVAPDELETPQDRARRDASRWTMIPLTRAMDTLVIHIMGGSGPIRNVLEEVARVRRDFVEWVTL
jgi:hypothetical protein